MSAYPRDLAVRILTRVLSDRLTLEQAFEQQLEGRETRSRFDGPDPLPAGARAWLLEVCSGTLRWKGRLELAVDSIAEKKKPSGWLRKVLLLAAYQLIVQERTSPGAVVSETVDEVRRKEGEAPARFANAILRKISERAAGWKQPGLREKPKDDELALWASLPSWLVRRAVADHGRPWLEAFARASLERPRIWVRAREPGWSPEASLKAEAGPVPASFVLGESGSVTAMSGFREGAFVVQDISSQRLVEEIASIAKRELGPIGAGAGGPRALDLCAAPGGKSIALAWKGFTVTATDRDEPRLSLLRSSLERVGAQVSVLARADVAGLVQQDLVWVDAPCTGSGIVRRHPDVRWLRQEKELEPLLKLQGELIREGWEKTRSGGLFAYSVCSILKEEGPRQLERLALGGTSLREWFFAPQDPPYGDGFWATLLRKP